MIGSFKIFRKIITIINIICFNCNILSISSPFYKIKEIIRILCYVSRIGRGRIDWEPHMERIFTGLSRAITLNKKPVHGELLKIEDIEFYAELIMNTIGPDRSDCQSSVLYRLEQLLKVCMHISYFLI